MKTKNAKSAGIEVIEEDIEEIPLVDRILSASSVDVVPRKPKTIQKLLRPSLSQFSPDQSEKDAAEAAKAEAEENDVSVIRKKWPTALKKRVVGTFHRLSSDTIDRNAGMAFLNKHNWPRGLQDTLFLSVSKIAMRFFVVDDSGEKRDVVGRIRLCCVVCCIVLCCAFFV